LTNARWEQLNAGLHKSAQTALAHSNVLAMKDMNSMKMDLHAEVTTFNIGGVTDGGQGGEPTPGKLNVKTGPLQLTFFFRLLLFAFFGVFFVF